MSDAGMWYVAVGGKQDGPISTQQVLDRIGGGSLDKNAYVYDARGGGSPADQRE